MPTQGTWLECNGQSTSAYPALAAIVGTNVPDYRGVFLRGLGSQTSTHYGIVTHSSATLGTLQGDAIRNIEGSGLITDVYGRVSGTVKKSGLITTAGGVYVDTANGNIDVSLVVPTANENRPINRSVIYLIKAR